MTGMSPPPGWEASTTTPPPDRWYGKYWACERYDCTALALPPHSHVMVPFPPELTAGRPYAATHLEGPDIDRVFVDWPALARELWTGHRPLPPEGHQYSLDLAVDPLTSESTATKAGQIAVRLRAIGHLEEEGADLAYVVDLARAIVASCDQIEDEDKPG